MYKDPFVEYQPQHPELLGFQKGGRSKEDTEAAKKKLAEQQRLRKTCPARKPTDISKFQKPKKPFVCITKKCKDGFKAQMEAYETVKKAGEVWKKEGCGEFRKKEEKRKAALKKKKREYENAVDKLIRNHEELRPDWMKGKWFRYGEKEQKLKDAIKKLGKFQLGAVGKIQDAIDIIKDGTDTLTGAGIDLLQKAIAEVVKELTPLAEEHRKTCMEAGGGGGRACQDGSAGVKSVEKFLEEM